MELAQERKPFSQYLFALLKSTSNSKYFEKKEESHSLRVSELINSERGGYLNIQKFPFQNTIRQ